MRYALMFPERDGTSWFWSIRSGWRTGRRRACRGFRRCLVRGSELKTSADGIRDYEQSNLLRRDVARRIRALGADARGHVSRPRQRHRRLEFGAPLRHDLHAAGLLRIREDRAADAAADRRQGHNGASARTLRRRTFAPTLGSYPVLGKAGGGAHPEAKLVEFPELGHAPQIQDPEVSTRPCSTACASRRRPTSQTTRGGRAFRPIGHDLLLATDGSGECLEVDTRGEYPGVAVGGSQRVRAVARRYGKLITESGRQT